LLEEKRIAVFTISLSPEYCINWPNAERVLNVLLSEMSINFKLPDHIERLDPL
jgi:hypothetical protein